MKMSKSDLQGKRVIVGMPALNEGKRIGNVLKNIPDFVDSVIVVDDGSKDDTSAVAKSYNAIVIRKEKNQGIGAGYKTIYDKFLEMKGDIMVLINSDGQHDPHEISKLVRPLIKNPRQYILGSRFKKKTGKGHFVRNIGNHLISIVYTVALKKRIFDSTTGFHATTYEVLKNADYKKWDNNYLIETRALLELHKRGIPITEVSIRCIYGDEVSSINPLRAGRQYMWMGIKAIFSQLFGIK